MLEDGSIVLNTGATDIGQGSDTVLCQMVAQSLQVAGRPSHGREPRHRRLALQLGHHPQGRVTFTTGRSVVTRRARSARKISEHAADIFECDVDASSCVPAARPASRASRRELPFAAIAARAHWAQGGPIIAPTAGSTTSRATIPSAAWRSGCPSRASAASRSARSVVDVEVDETTARSTCCAPWSALDVGKAINPLAVEADRGLVRARASASRSPRRWSGMARGSRTRP